jgi:hypothetical protein
MSGGRFWKLVDVTPKAVIRKLPKTLPSMKLAM